MKERVPTVVAIVFGIVVLLGYFLDLPALNQLRSYLVNTAATLAALALLVGVLNLVRVHTSKALDLRPGWPYSAALLLGLGSVLLLWAASYFVPQTRNFLGFVLTYIQTPLEAAMGALLAFVLLAAGVRLTRQRVTANTILFILVSLILLLGLISFKFIPEVLPEIRSWIVQVPAVAGARGIVLGIALGAIATGLRVILGADRPYGE